MLRSRGANPKSLTSTRVTEIDGRRLFLTNLDRVLWREEGLTQADLVDYYLDVADHALPFLINRPLSLLRNAEAAGTRDSIFRKTAPPGLPPWVPTRRVRTEHAGLGSAEYVVGCDRAALIHLTNLGYVSYHPWSCTVDALDRPDQLLFDLDPTAIAFREVRNAAMLVREVLATFRLRSWVKTSGGSGLHVMVPLAPVHTFEQVLTAASLVTRMARTREPALFSFDMRRARRRGKILIDVHRNHRGATLISPYSVRGQPGAAVAMPLEWPELERAVYPDDFHLKNARERLHRKGDALRDFFRYRQSLDGVLDAARSRRAKPMA